MNKSVLLLPLVFLLLCIRLAAQQGNADIIGITAEGERVSRMMQWDSAYSESLAATLLKLENDPQKNRNRILFARLEQHLSSINAQNKSRVKDVFEKNIISWMVPVAESLSDTAALQGRILSSLPDSYIPAKILVPDILNDSILFRMADQYPKELFYALRYMIKPDALRETERAAVNAPYEAKQYLHYSNNVNDLLLASPDPRVLKLFEIYKYYRYGSNSFYLLDPVFRGELTIQEAHELSKDKEQLYNELAKVFMREGGIGKFSAEEKLSELSDRYVRRIMFQRYLSPSTLKFEQLAVLSKEAVTYFLFSSQNLFKKKDMENLAILLSDSGMDTIRRSDISGLPIEWLEQMKARLDEEELAEDFSSVIDPGLWASISDVILIATAEADIPKLDLQTNMAVPVKPVFVFKPFASNLTDEEKEIIRLENNPFDILQDISVFTDKLYSRDMLMSLASEYPLEMMSQLDKFADEPYAVDICEKLAITAPLTMKNFLIKPGHKIHDYLQKSTDSTVMMLYRINKELGTYTRAYILLDDIMHGSVSLLDADSICKEKELLLPYLIDIYIRDSFLGRYTVEMELEYRALDFIRNSNISGNTDHSYDSELYKLDARTLFTYMIFGEQEIISQTFNRMYDRLVKLEPNLYDLFSSLNFRYIDRFTRMAVHYGREYDLFGRLGQSRTNELLSLIFEGLGENGRDISDAIEAADIIMSMEDRVRLNYVQQVIRDEYERLGKEDEDEGFTTYGILASILAQKLHDGWSAYAAPYYKIPSLISIPVNSLFNDKLVNIQQYYFYNDRDGISSYRSFLSQYENSNFNWEIEDKGSFVKITSRSGKSVEIYANKPAGGEEGIAQLEKYLSDNKLEPLIVVHRGLSTHTLKTFERVKPSARLILDGSCGGFHIQNVALENAPDAQILCNRNIGTMLINDPMFKQISESIRLGRDIVWPNFWRDMEVRLGSNPYFKDYIPPHKNVAALIIKAYYDLLGISN